MPVSLSPLPPEEAVRFFKKKGYAIRHDWRDIWQEEHAAAFTVAKAMRVDILEDIRGELEKALENGTTFAEFKKNLRPMLEKKGWWGMKEVVDPLTGEIVRARLGSVRRLQIIYDTNIRMAHAAGRWEQIESVKARMPYLRYSAVMDSRTRPRHKSMHGTILPVDHPFWDTHYPPNGWRCRCIVMQLSARDLERYGWEVSGDPLIQYRQWTDRRNGRVLKVPRDVDPGFAYNVGKARMRAYTPPPAGGLPPLFHSDHASDQRDLPSLPDPSPVPEGMMLKEGLEDKAYMQAFLKEFDADLEKPAIWTDPAGEKLIISEDLFRSAGGTLKLEKGTRRPYMALLARSLKDPDEIWWQWEKREKDGGWMLRRRYLKRWETEDGSHALTVFDWQKSQWVGATTFAPYPDRGKAARERYVQKQRGGLLAWRKKEPDQ